MLKILEQITAKLSACQQICGQTHPDISILNTHIEELHQLVTQALALPGIALLLKQKVDDSESILECLRRLLVNYRKSTIPDLSLLTINLEKTLKQFSTLLPQVLETQVLTGFVENGKTETFSEAIPIYFTGETYAKNGQWYQQFYKDLNRSGLNIFFLSEDKRTSLHLVYCEQKLYTLSVFFETLKAKDGVSSTEKDYIDKILASLQTKQQRLQTLITKISDPRFPDSLAKKLIEDYCSENNNFCDSIAKKYNIEEKFDKYTRYFFEQKLQTWFTDAPEQLALVLGLSSQTFLAYHARVFRTAMSGQMHQTSTDKREAIGDAIMCNPEDATILWRKLEHGSCEVSASCTVTRAAFYLPETGQLVPNVDTLIGINLTATVSKSPGSNPITVTPATIERPRIDSPQPKSKFLNKIFEGAGLTAACIAICAGIIVLFSVPMVTIPLLIICAISVGLVGTCWGMGKLLASVVKSYFEDKMQRRWEAITQSLPNLEVIHPEDITQGISSITVNIDQSIVESCFTTVPEEELTKFSNCLTPPVTAGVLSSVTHLRGTATTAAAPDDPSAGASPAVRP